MLAPKHYTIAIVFLFIAYWFVLFPLLWFFLKPVMSLNGIFNGIPSYWIPSVFWGAALIIFILVLLILWCVMFCVPKKQVETAEDNNVNLDSYTIHGEVNKNIKNSGQTSEYDIEPRKDNIDAYRDIQDIFHQQNNFKPKLNNATQTISQTVDERRSSSYDDNVYNDINRRHTRLSSCDGCSKLITDDEMVKFFVNKKVIPENDDNMEKYEVVGTSVQQAKRFRIDENIPVNNDEGGYSNMKPQLRKSETPSISIPVRPSSRMKSELFIYIDNDGPIPEYECK